GARAHVGDPQGLARRIRQCLYHAAEPLVLPGVHSTSLTPPKPAPGRVFGCLSLLDDYKPLLAQTHRGRLHLSNQTYRSGFGRSPACSAWSASMIVVTIRCVGVFGGSSISTCTPGAFTTRCGVSFAPVPACPARDCSQARIRRARSGAAATTWATVTRLDTVLTASMATLTSEGPR